MIIVILAAGRGNRLKKTIPKNFNYITKCLVEFNGNYSIVRLLNQLSRISEKSKYLVIGHEYKKVIESINSSQLNLSQIKFIINKNYLKDSNFSSLYLALNKIIKDGENLNQGLLIIEADSFLMDKDFTEFNNFIKKYNKNKNKSEILWTSKGLSKVNDSGGFLVPSEEIKFHNKYGLIKDVYISNIRKNKFSLKMYGLTWMNKYSVENWYEKAKNILSSNKTDITGLYFHDLIFDYKDDYKMYYYDFGENVLSFNNYDEYINCLNSISQ